MSKKAAPQMPTPASINKYVTKAAAQYKKSRKKGHGHHAEASTMRTAEYKGHKIVVCTTYKVTVDGKPVTGHLGVADDGQVHYHPIPNKSFDSAIDLVKSIIDVFPDDFTKTSKKSAKRPARSGHHH